MKRQEPLCPRTHLFSRRYFISPIKQLSASLASQLFRWHVEPSIASGARHCRGALDAAGPPDHKPWILLEERMNRTAPGFV